MVGLFINTLPVRGRVREESRVAEWLEELQGRQAEARQYEYAPLVEVQGWSEVERGQPLFESILVFENYPLDETPQDEGEGLQIPDVRSFERNNYPLAILVMPGAQLAFQAIYDSRRFDDVTINRMLQHLSILLEGIATHPDWQLIDISLLIEDRESPALPSFDLQDTFGGDKFLF
jgi:non-ribosomal peptide synthetase component F